MLYNIFLFFCFLRPLIQAIAIKFTAVLFQFINFMPTFITKHISSTKLSATSQKFNMC